MPPLRSWFLSYNVETKIPFLVIDFNQHQVNGNDQLLFTEAYSDLTLCLEFPYRYI